MSEMQVPSLYHLRCPKCGAPELRLLGEKGALGKSVGSALAFGAIGALVASSNADGKPVEAIELKYKCKKCGNKFMSNPLLAGPDEFLSVPCRVSFTRVSSVLGMAVSQILLLNGVRISPIKNGQTFVLETILKYNTIHVIDVQGVAFADEYNFEAVDGGEVVVRFKRKFLR